MQQRAERGVRAGHRGLGRRVEVGGPKQQAVAVAAVDPGAVIGQQRVHFARRGRRVVRFRDFAGREDGPESGVDRARAQARPVQLAVRDTGVERPRAAMRLRIVKGILMPVHGEKIPIVRVRMPVRLQRWSLVLR